MAAKLACDKASDVEIAAITVLHHRMMIEYVQRSLSTYLALNQETHRSIVRASYNHVLVELWELLAPRAMNLYPARWSAAVQEDEAMQAALLARDGARLGARMEPHYLNGLAVMRRRCRPCPSKWKKCSHD